jgi:hypothetical protein
VEVIAMPAPAVVSFSTQDDSSGLDFTVTAPSSIANGNMLVAFEICLASSGIIPPSAPTGWTSLGSEGWDSGSGAVVIFYKIASSEPGTYTFHSGGVGCECVVYIFNLSGATGSAPDAISAGNAGHSTSLNTGAITVPAGDHLVLAGYGAGGSQTFTIAGGATDVGQITGTQETADTSYIIHTAGSYTPAASVGIITFWGGLACSVLGTPNPPHPPIIVCSPSHPSFWE